MVNSNTIIELLAMIEAFVYVSVYAYLQHKYNIETSAIQDKTTLTIIFSSFVGIIKGILIFTGKDYCDPYIQLFSFMQGISLMVIATMIGIQINQDIKNIKKGL